MNNTLKPKSVGWLSPAKIFWTILIVATNWTFFLEATEINKGAIPLLNIKDGSGETITLATGFVVRPEGVLITNYHVLIGAHSVEAIFPDGSTFFAKSLYKADRVRDFAVLQLSGKVFSTLELGDSKSVKPFSYTSALGYPYEDGKFQANHHPNPIRQNFGMALGIHPRTQPRFSILYTTTPLSPGFSGGPLVDKNNRVIAIAMVEGRAVNLALPINYVKPFLNQAISFSFDELRKKDEISAETLYYKGSFELHEKSKPKAALEFFNKVLEMDSSFVSAYYDSAIAYRNLGMIDRAIDAYEKALEIFPKFPAALSNLGGQYFRSGSLDKAVENFQKAIDAFPNFIEALSNLGAVLNKLKRYKEALPHLEKSVRLNPDFAVAQFNLGNSYYGLNRYKEASVAFQKAANLGLNFVSLHWKMFEVYSREKNKKLAISELEQILKIDPENRKARSELNALKQ
tara:strand:- start:1015 stop:2388 length:1374 start_codon:yes stop_codon:yes gene_type:complete